MPVPPVNAMYNLVKHRPVGTPPMEMNAYDVNALLRILQRAGCHHVYLRFTETSVRNRPFYGVTFVFRKAAINIVSTLRCVYGTRRVPDSLWPAAFRVVDRQPAGPRSGGDAIASSRDSISVSNAGRLGGIAPGTAGYLEIGQTSLLLAGLANAVQDQSGRQHQAARQ